METGHRDSKDEQFLHKLESLVREHLGDENFGVEHLASEAGYSRSQLYRRLKLLVGLSPSVFIRRIRLDEALIMLKYDEATTSEIAYRVGFHSPSYFHRCFHKRYGLTPGEFKAQHGVLTEIAPKYHLNNPLKKSGNIPFYRGHRPLPSVVKVLFLIVLALSIVMLSSLLISGYPNAERSRTTIAVLPFSYVGKNENTRVLADGMADDLLHRLSGIKEVRAISRTSSQVYRDHGKQSVMEIAQALNADYLVEGSVQCQGDRARIHVKLIHTKSDSPVWSQRYNRDLDDIFALQTEISSQIASHIKLMIQNRESVTAVKQTGATVPGSLTLLE